MAARVSVANIVGSVKTAPIGAGGASFAGSQSLAKKASGRRERISIFGGLKSKTVGRRTVAGKIFNRRNTKKKPASDAGVTTPTPVTEPGVEIYGSDDDDE